MNFVMYFLSSVFVYNCQTQLTPNNLRANLIINEKKSAQFLTSLSKQLNINTCLVYAFYVRKGLKDSFINLLMPLFSRIKENLKKLDTDVHFHVVNCTIQKVDELCDDRIEFHYLYGYHDMQTFRMQFNATENLVERNIMKLLLKFINSSRYNGCEDVILENLSYADERSQDDEQEWLWNENRKDEGCLEDCTLDFGNVKILSPKTISSFLVDKNLSVVLFHLNVDSQSRSLLETFVNAATLRTDENMGSVSCNDYPDLCDKYDIVSWPQIWFFKGLEKYKLYKLPYEEFLIFDSLDLIARPPVTVLENELVYNDFLNNFYLSSGRNIPSFTIGFFDSSSSEEYMKFLKVAVQFHGRYILGATFAKNAKSWLNKRGVGTLLKLPTLVTIKVEEEFSSTRLYPYNTFEESLIGAFVKKSSEPSLLQLSARTPSEFFIHNDTLVIGIVSDANDNTLKILKYLSQNGDTSLIRYSFVDETKQPAMACKILIAYKLPFSNFSKLIARKRNRVYFYAQNYSRPLETKDVAKWIRDIKFDNVTPSVYLHPTNFTERSFTWNYVDRIYGSGSTVVTSLGIEETYNNEEYELESNEIERNEYIMDEL